MVEFLLIFALGFLAAALIGMLVTPAIYGRIVKLTEKRIEATVPLSVAEIKGKSDLMRAGFASETARLSTQLEKERESLATREFANNKLQAELANVTGEKSEAEQNISNLETQSADLRSEARKQQQLIDKLSGTVTDFERMKRADTQEISRLNNDLMSISTEVESMKIDLATSGTESVSLRSEIHSLEDHRQQLQQEIKALADTAHDLQQEFQREQEGHNNSRIELAATQSTLADAEMQLGHAKEEIEALQLVHGELTNEGKILAETIGELQEALSLEHKSHDNTRSDLAAKQAELVEHQAMLVKSTENIESQLQELRMMTENERRAAQTLKKSEQKIEALTSKLEGTRAALEKSRSATTDLKDKLSEMKTGEKRYRKEAERAAEHLTDLQARMQEENSNAEQKNAELEAVRIALVAGDRDLAESRNRAAELENRLMDENRRAEELNARLSKAEESPAPRERSNEAKHTSAVEATPETGPVQPETRKASGADQNRAELETQVDALKDALQKSKETSGEFRQHLKKMRREVHQLNRSDTDKPDTHASDETSDDDQTTEPELTPAANGIGRAMQTDQVLKRRVEELRRRQQTLMADLATGNKDQDDKLREEIADIAALAVWLSAHRDGQKSPIRTLIADTNNRTPKSSTRKSLAQRARAQVDS